jgi:hypothetical protein
MNTQQTRCLDAAIFARQALIILLFITISVLLTGCIGPVITDSDWQGRDTYNYNQMPPSTSAPPRQWDPYSIGIMP